MRILICRHGDPDYKNDSLTEKGVREAELLSRRLVKLNPTKIYCSVLGRAQKTAEPTVEKTGIKPVICDWLREYPISANTFAGKDCKEGWLCPWSIPHKEWFTDERSTSPTEWYECDRCKGQKFREHQQLIRDEMDKIMADLGLVRDGDFWRRTPEYENHRDDTILIFCHYGMTLAILSAVLPISAVTLWNGFNIDTTGVTELQPDKASPDTYILRCMRLGDVSHLYGSDVVNSGESRNHWYEDRDGNKAAQA